MKLTENQQKTVEENIGLVHFVIKKLGFSRRKFRNLEYEDLFQSGCIGLCKAAETYDPGYGTAFSTYAYVVIRNEIVVETVKDSKILDCDDLDFITDRETCTESHEDNVINDIMCEEYFRWIQQIYENSSDSRKKYIDVLMMKSQGMKTDEIAKAVNWSVQTVTKAQTRAKRYLKGQLEKDGRKLYA